MRLAGAILGLVLAMVWTVSDPRPPHAADDAEVTKLRGELEQLRGRLPSQSHAMMDVGYHETRSHLRWAVRIVPVRRTSTGEVDLRGLLEVVDRGGLTEIGKAIGERDPGGFATAYRHTLEGCYTCHKASEKPYLRPRIPAQPETRIINFDPSATWP